MPSKYVKIAQALQDTIDVCDLATHALTSARGSLVDAVFDENLNLAEESLERALVLVKRVRRKREKAK